MTTMERRYEKFARAVDRRAFLRTSASGIFAGVTAVFVMPAWNASATGPCPNYAEATECGPPHNVYCSSGHCSGARCAGGCSYNYNYWPDACWCTKAVRIGPCTSRWYKCCDCYCGSSECGCREYHDTYGGLTKDGLCRATGKPVEVAAPPAGMQAA